MQRILKTLLLAFIPALLYSIPVNAARLSTVFAHGVLGNKYHVLWYAPPGNPIGWHIIENPYHSFNFADVPDRKEDLPKVDKLNIGQDGDINILADNVQQVIATNCTSPDDGIILVGYSRGAVTIFNFLGVLSMDEKDPFYSILNLTSAERQRILHCIKAVVLEAPLYDATDIKESMHRLLSTSKAWLLWLGSFVPGKHRIFQSLSEYDPEGIHPNMVASKIDKNIPILFVHSTKDEVNPISSSIKLYNELKNSNHPNAYFLKLTDGKHVKYNIDKDAQGYMAGTHAFYSLFGLPHNPALVAAGLPRITNQGQ